ncbi:MAG: DUF3857 domain-containing protein [Thermoguttaceae bacterium]|jgi:transglutaminase-like putative cysteine protease/tetratricopeptide (TPR) repeat protein
MRRSFLFIAVITLSMLAGPLGMAAGGEPWDGPAMAASPAEVLKAAIAKPVADPADLEMLLDDTRYEFDAQGRMCCTTRRVYRCLTEKGFASGAWTGGEWCPWYQDRPAIRARVITPDGAVHLLDPKTIAEAPADQPSADELTDRRALRAPLPAVKVGAVVEEEIVVRDIRPFFNQGMAGQHFLVAWQPTRKWRLTLEAPAELPLRYEVRALDLKPDRSETSGRVRLVFQTQPPSKPAFPEPMQPPECPSWPSVAFSTGKSWGEVAAGYVTLAEPQIDIAPVQAMVRETLGGETDRRKTAVKLLARLQDSVRYVAIEFGQSAIVPRKPQEVLTRRYGDCKDQATLLSAMLRAAGHPARLALICAGSESDLVPSLPGLGWFNHVVVYMPGNPPLWIDPTAREVAFGELPMADQGRWALVAAPGTKELVKTPRSDYHLTSVAETNEYYLSEIGKDRVKIAVAYGGPFAQGQRMLYSAFGREKMTEYWKNMAQNTIFSKTLSHIEYSSLQEKAKPFDVRVEFADARVSTFGQGEIIVHLTPSKLFNRLPTALTSQPEEAASGKPSSNSGDKPGENAMAVKERKTPLALRMPHVAQILYRITPPPGYAAGELPKDQSKRCGPVKVEQHFQIQKDSAVEATFRLDTGPGAFTAAEVNALRQAVAELGGGNVTQWQIPIAFNHRARKYFAEGRVKESLAECRTLLQQLPNHAEHHGFYAQVLVAAGFGEAARREARREVELAPNSAPALTRLAWVLSHDLLGRQYGPGMDWSGAADCYRKSLKIEPSERFAQVAYATLLEFTPDGLRDVSEARIEEALQQYRQIRKDRGKVAQAGEVDNAFVTLLLRANQFAELETVAASIDSPTMRPLLLAAIAAQRGAAEAERKARTMGQGADGLRTLLRTAALNLDGARLYPKAKDLYEMAGTSGDDAAQVKAIVQALGRIRRYDEIQFAQDDARRPAQQLCIGLLMGGKRKAQAMELFVKKATEAERLDSLVIVDRSLREWRRTDPQNLRAPQSNADLVSLFDFTTEGDKNSGYRISVNGQLLMPFRCHVVMEGGVYRLLPLGGEECLGAAALDRLAAGDVAAAKRWLEWAWAQQQPSLGWFDSFTGSPFAHLWRELEHGRAEHIRVAAAALSSRETHAQQAIPILVEAQKLKPPASQALQIDRALMQAYNSVEQPQQLLEIAERLLKDRPNVKELQMCRLCALQAMGRRDEALKSIRNYLDKAQGSSSSLDAAIAGMASALGESDLARKQLISMTDRGNPPPLALYGLAWCSMVGQHADDKARDAALKALVNIQPRYEYRLLATLAAIEAELGKPAEAMEHLARSQDLQCGRLSAVDWYAMGRLAEHYQLEDIAADLYHKVTPLPKPRADDVFLLAQQQLKKLKK